MKRRTTLGENKGLYLFLIAGSLHSLATFYWAFGGDLGLATVGEWTIEFKQTYGIKFLIVLLFVGILKLAATWIPIIHLGSFIFVMGYGAINFLKNSKQTSILII